MFRASILGFCHRRLTSSPSVRIDTCSILRRSRAAPRRADFARRVRRAGGIVRIRTISLLSSSNSSLITSSKLCREDLLATFHGSRDALVRIWIPTPFREGRGGLRFPSRLRLLLGPLGGRCFGVLHERVESSLVDVELVGLFDEAEPGRPSGGSRAHLFPTALQGARKRAEPRVDRRATPFS